MKNMLTKLEWSIVALHLIDNIRVRLLVNKLPSLSMIKFYNDCLGKHINRKSSAIIEMNIDNFRLELTGESDEII